MSHEHEQMENGETAFVSARGKTPWHGLGVVVPEGEGLLTVDRALQLGGLNWGVEKRPAYHAVPMGELDGTPQFSFEEVPNRFLIVRETDNKVLSVVGSSYEPVQNREGFELVQALLQTSDAVIDTAGSLFEGRRVFMSALMPETLKIAGEDYEVYMLFTNSHDGSKGMQVSIVTIRVVCRNTEQMALQGAKHTWSVAHRGNVKEKMEEAITALELKDRYLAAFNREVEELIAKELEKETFEKILRASFPDQKVQTELNIKQVLDIHQSSENIDDDWRFSAYGGYSALTEWTSWKTYQTEEARMKSVLGWHQGTRDKVAKALISL